MRGLGGNVGQMLPPGSFGYCRQRGVGKADFRGARGALAPPSSALSVCHCSLRGAVGGVGGVVEGAGA